MERRIIILDSGTSLPDGMYIKHAQKIPFNSVLITTMPCVHAGHYTYEVFITKECFWMHRAIRLDSSPIDPTKTEGFQKIGELIPSYGISGKYRGHNFYEGDRYYCDSLPLHKSGTIRKGLSEK